VALNLDSLTLVSLVAQVEAIYSVDLTAEELVSLTDCARVSDFVARLKELIGARAA
jgi:acyl carrier protein